MAKYYLYYVYILKCNDGNYYTGVTNNISPKLSQHENELSKDSYTYSRRPLELVFHAEYYGY